MVARKTGTSDAPAGSGEGGEGEGAPESALTETDKKWITETIAAAVGGGSTRRGRKSGAQAGEGEDDERPLTVKDIERIQEEVTREAVALLHDEKAATDHDAEHERLKAAAEQDKEKANKPTTLSSAFRAIFGNTE